MIFISSVETFHFSVHDLSSTPTYRSILASADEDCVIKSKAPEQVRKVDLQWNGCFQQVNNELSNSTFKPTRIRSSGGDEIVCNYQNTRLSLLMKTMWCGRKLQGKWVGRPWDEIVSSDTFELVSTNCSCHWGCVKTVCWWGLGCKNIELIL